MAQVSDLAMKKCTPCKGGVAPLRQDEVGQLLKQLDGWEHVNGRIAKTYTFTNHYQVLAFVNAAAWISHREDHHPDISFGYKTCTITFWTHTVGGLSENDFICAAKAQLLAAE